MKLDDRLGAGGDAIYAALMETHEGLSTEQSHALNARLVLMLANEVGDPARIVQIFDEARQFSKPAGG